jgi:MtaA/CmuA family methyltransferase
LNPLARLHKRLAGEPVDKVPNFNIVMAFAAHFTGDRLSRYYLDYRILAKATLVAAETFGIDVAQTISDPYREAGDCGLEVEFPDDDIPLRKRPLIADPADAAALRIPAPWDGGRMNDRLDAVRILHEKVGGELPVMGWVEGGLALVNVLRGDTNLMLDLYDRPDWVKDLLERATEAQIAFARAQVEAGADVIGLGDAIASQISPEMYREFALPYEKRIFEAVRGMGAICRLHICGNTTRIVPLMAETGADIVDLDWMVDMRAAALCYGTSGPAVCGNFDPVTVMLRGSEQQIISAVRESLAAGGPRCISAAGCEIPDRTPPLHLHLHNSLL